MIAFTSACCRAFLLSLWGVCKRPCVSFSIVLTFGLILTVPVSFYLLVKNAVYWKQAVDIVYFHNVTVDNDADTLVSSSNYVKKLTNEFGASVRFGESAGGYIPMFGQSKSQEFTFENVGSLRNLKNILQRSDIYTLLRQLLSFQLKTVTLQNLANFPSDAISWVSNLAKIPSVGSFGSSFTNDALRSPYLIYGYFLLELTFKTVFFLLFLWAISVFFVIVAKVNVFDESTKIELEAQHSINRNGKRKFSPFLYSGILLGFFSGLCAWLLTKILIFWLQNPVSKLFFRSEIFPLVGLNRNETVFLIISSAALGCIGAWLVLKKVKTFW